LSAAPGTDGAFGGLWCFAITLAVRYSAHQTSDASLFSIWRVAGRGSPCRLHVSETSQL